MNVLAINFNHDGAATLMTDGEITGYVNTERGSRRKKHPGVRPDEIEDVLDQAQLSLRDIDCVHLVNLNNMDSYDVVRLHGTTLKETWPDFWIDRSFSHMRLLGRVVPCMVQPPHTHHALHAATSYFFSPFESGVSFACDVVGAQAFFLSGNEQVGTPYPVSMVAPFVYHMVSEHVFGNGLVGAGKLMGLAPYGAGSPASIDYAALSKLDAEAAFSQLLEHARHDPILIQEGDVLLNASVAHYAQAFLEFELSSALAELYNQCVRRKVEPNLCLSGGTALNSVANQKCFETSRFRSLYLHPACGDDGTSIGATLLWWHHFNQQPKRSRSNRQAMYSCRTYEHTLPEVLQEFSDRIEIVHARDYVRRTAESLARGEVIGWFQGPSEIGPRALGNRSILADPRDPHMRDYLNKHVKQREAFRPFAPSVLNEHALEWCGLLDSPFMLRVTSLRTRAVPAVTHIDGTARVQTVSREDNPTYHELIGEFMRITGVPMVLNTSFNGKGEPIVESPRDAIECMFGADLDAVVFSEIMVKPRVRQRQRPPRESMPIASGIAR